MHVLMNIQTALLIECLITHLTGKMALTTLFAFMTYQTTLATVCLITHITNIRSLTTVFAFMPYQTTLITVCHHTHHKHNGVHHYAIIDVLSDGPLY